ncbi:arylsulfatase [Planctomycetes bacterium K23_9]|uniref:Arylsulfatase n=1 Tax=Stieleria marina TaxID=1930275 RepID=A0A517NPI9_9BACT|nr:Arylsulfatase [Planctomycetes bacterium K23_9]
MPPFLHRLFIALAVSACFVGSLSAATAKQPNVIVILTDDQGWGDLSLHENVDVSTPNIDSLARDGAEVEHFYVCAVCSPTRAEFLTGRYHSRMGVYSTSAGGERFNVDEQTIAEVFRRGGYATAAYGKWHSGMQYPYHPNARGFDDYYGFCSGHWGNYFSPMLEHNGKIVKGEGFLVDDLTTHAIDFISDHRDRPFFCYLPLNTPHSPMQVPDRFWEKFKNKSITPDPESDNQKRQNLTHTRAALAMCENIDMNVGRVLSHLDEVQLANDTIVVYFSDNGPNGARFNGGMRGRKGSTHEGGLRSPLLIRYPAVIKPGTKVSRIAAAIDLLPTLSDLAGISPDGPKPLDGKSIAPLLEGDSTGWSERFLFSTWNGKTTVRSDRYRLQGTGELFDIKTDPRERVDLAKQQPDIDIANDLRQKLAAWTDEVKPVQSKNDGKLRPITLADRRAEFHQLPARDAIGHGGVQRSNRFPNCTYMRNWTSTEDEITWDVDVLGGGRFEVEMYYACPADSVGAKIQLRIGGESINATIATANDTPQIGADDDRFKRVEGYVKDWKAMTLGQITLRPGRKTLRLRATEVPGSQVVEMRLLMFRKL